MNVGVNITWLDQVTSYMSDDESGGESVSSRGFRGLANYYTGADDKVISFFLMILQITVYSGDSSIHRGQWPL